MSDTKTTPRHDTGTGEGEDLAMPATLKVGDFVSFHLPSHWRGPGRVKDDYPHRIGIVTKVYRGRLRHKNSVHVDLAVFLSTHDGGGQEQLMPVQNAQYDPECPEGFFCMPDDADFPTVGDIQAIIDADQNKSEDTEDEEDEDVQPIGAHRGRLTSPAPTSEHSTPFTGTNATLADAGKPAPATPPQYKEHGPAFPGGEEMKAKMENKTPEQVHKETPKFESKEAGTKETKK